MKDRGQAPVEDWRFLDLIVERSDMPPALISSLIVAPDLAAELVAQFQLLNDVLDLDEGTGGAACPAA